MAHMLGEGAYLMVVCLWGHRVVLGNAWLSKTCVLQSWEYVWLGKVSTRGVAFFLGTGKPPCMRTLQLLDFEGKWKGKSEGIFSPKRTPPRGKGKIGGKTLFPFEGKLWSKGKNQPILEQR